jgi:hypothetical protein
MALALAAVLPSTILTASSIASPRSIHQRMDCSAWFWFSWAVLCFNACRVTLLVILLACVECCCYSTC